MPAKTIDLSLSHDAATEKVIAALAQEGFGVITRIDMHKTLAEKLGVDFRNYTILGACNPKLAHQALSEAPEIGLLLPCNVTVEDAEDGVRVRLPDAEELMGQSGEASGSALGELARDANERLERVSAALTA
ncbi:DUF302 domain-containing protein [Halovulum sp. GXIMD14794]